MTTSRPDIVVIEERELHMLELTVCGNTWDALTRLEGKYSTIKIGELKHYNQITPTDLPRNCLLIPLSECRKVLTRAATTAKSRGV